MVKFVGPEGVNVQGGIVKGDHSPALRMKDLTWPMVIPHRGAGYLAPENTFLAFDHCISLGFKFIEIDVRLTTDGGLILHHDTTTTRTTGVNNSIEHMTLSAASGLTVKPALFGFTNLPEEKLHTLDELFERYYTTPVCWLIEAKALSSGTSAYKTALGNAIVACVNKWNMSSRVAVQSFEKLCVAPAIAAGIPGGYLESSGATTPASLIAEGYSYYGMRSDASSLNLSNAHSSALKLFVYGTASSTSPTIPDMQSRSTVSTFRNTYPNINVISDDPWYVSASRTTPATRSLGGSNWDHGIQINPIEWERGTIFPSGGPTSPWIPSHPPYRTTTTAGVAPDPSYPPMWKREGDQVYWKGGVQYRNSSDADAAMPDGTTILNSLPASASPMADETIALYTRTPGSGSNRGGSAMIYPNGTVTAVGGLGSAGGTTHGRWMLTGLSYPTGLSTSERGLLLARYTADAANPYLNDIIGDVCPLPSRATGYKITVSMKFLDIRAGAVDSAQLTFCLPNDSGYHDSTKKDDCYNLLMRVNGTLELFKSVGGTSTSLGTVATTAISTGGTATISAQVSSTSIICKREDTNSTMTTVNDTSVSGLYLGVGVRRTNTLFYDLIIT